MELVKKLAEIQQSLNAPKSQFNKFGKYSYRNCEDILKAVKPLLGECILTLSDDIVQIGDRFYVKATASIRDGKDTIEVSAFARECLSKKGMDDAQLTGSCSSYSRKYSLNGLFSIDDSAGDPDSMDNSANNIDKTFNGNTGYVLDDNAKSWIESAKQDRTILNQIEDPEYRKFIEGKL